MAWVSRPSFWLVVLLLACAVYAPALGYGFVSYDDEHYVFNNSVVLQGLSWSGIRWAFVEQRLGHYHPLTWLSHQLDISLFGLDGRGHHATSVLLHVLSTLLLFQFLRRTTGRIGRAGVVALLFALHPLHVEPVVWISSRKDVLSTLFWMIALIAYERYARAPTLFRYAAVVLAYAAGLLSKPMVITLPVILLLLDYWPLRRTVRSESERAESSHAIAERAATPRSWVFLGAEKLPLLALAALSSWVTTTSASKFGVMQVQNLPLWVRIQNSLVSYVIYLRELVWPVDLSIHHERFQAPPDALNWWLAVAVLGAISAVAVWLRRSHPYLLSGWLFYLVSFLPVIGLLQYGGHSIADRYAYVPSIGAFIMVAWGLHALIGRLRNARVLAPAVTSAVTLVLALLSLLQVGYWRSGEELFQHALDVSPNSPRLHNLLAIELTRRGALDEAAQHYTRAIELSPSFTKGYNNLGVLLYRRKRVSEAIEVYRSLLRIDPRNQWGHANLALALATQGHAAEAEKHYRLAIQIAPDYVSARTGLARLLASLGRIDEARAELEVAIAQYPTRSDLRALLEQLHKPAESANP